MIYRDRFFFTDSYLYGDLSACTMYPHPHLHWVGIEMGPCAGVHRWPFYGVYVIERENWKFILLTGSIERKDGILLRHEVGLWQLSSNLASDNIYRQLLYFQSWMDVLYITSESHTFWSNIWIIHSMTSSVWWWNWLMTWSLGRFCGSWGKLSVPSFDTNIWWPKSRWNDLYRTLHGWSLHSWVNGYFDLLIIVSRACNTRLKIIRFGDLDECVD